jgi:hypothetical protein
MATTASTEMSEIQKVDETSNASAPRKSHRAGDRRKAMITSLLRMLVLYCALVDMAQATNKAGQMTNLHQQLAKAAREL